MSEEPKKIRRSYWHECVMTAASDAIASEMTIEELVTATVQVDTESKRPISKPDKRREIARRAVLNLIAQGLYAIKPGNILVLS